MDATQVLHHLNRRHSTAFSLVGQCTGGTRGAYEVIDDQRRAVLKFGPGTQWLARLRQAEAIATRLRGAGYPTPRSLLLGTTPEGDWYQLQEFVTGVPMAAPLTAANVDLLLMLNDKQAHQHHAEDTGWPNWSRHAREVVFADASSMAASLHGFSPTTRGLLLALQDWTAPHVDAPLSTGDAVHGDFLPENVLVRDGRIAAVIDVAQAGCGTRALDLARTLVWWYGDMAGAERRRLLEHLAAVATEAERTICLASQVIDVATFVIEHYPHEVGHFVRRGYHLLDAARQVPAGVNRALTRGSGGPAHPRSR